jgi:hypothetical protein
MKIQTDPSVLRERAKAIRSEYAKEVALGNEPEHQDLYEKIRDLSTQLEHKRLAYPPQKITELREELGGAIAELDARRQ